MFKIEIKQNNKYDTVFVYGNKSLLSELEENHIMINHNCRQGHCGTCVATIIKGEVHHQKSLYPLKYGEILVCQAIPISDISIVVQL